MTHTSYPSLKACTSTGMLLTQLNFFLQFSTMYHAHTHVQMHAHFIANDLFRPDE